MLQIFKELIQNSGFWSLIGVIIGLILGEGIRYYRYRKRIKSLKKIIKEELQSIRYQILQKKNVVEKIIKELEKGEILPGQTVGIISIGYNKHIFELYEHLNPLERNCLHVIYEHLKMSESTLDNFEINIKDDIKTGVMDEPLKAYIDSFKDIEDSYAIVEKLIEGYLMGRPEDVFYLEKDIKEIAFG